jgi:hypothetical protein
MSKVLNVTRDGDFFEMCVELGKGHREKWTYERVESAVGVSWVMIGREDTK